MKSPNSPRPPQGHHPRFLGALADAAESELDGEVVAVWERSIGRIYLSGGKIAWVVVSSLDRTLLQHLVEQGGLSMEALRSVFVECRESKANFAEALIDQGLGTRETIRRHLLEYGSEGLLEVMSWPEGQTLFIPHARSYSGSLLFEVEEMTRCALELDVGGRLAESVRQLMTHVAHLDIEGRARMRLEADKSVSPWDRAVRRISRVSLNIFEELEDVEGFMMAVFLDEQGQALITRRRRSEVKGELEGYTAELLGIARAVSAGAALSAPHLVQLDSPDGVILLHPVAVDDGDDSPQSRRHVAALFSLPMNNGLARVRIRTVARALAKRQQ